MKSYTVFLSLDKEKKNSIRSNIDKNNSEHSTFSIKKLILDNDDDVIDPIQEIPPEYPPNPIQEIPPEYPPNPIQEDMSSEELNDHHKINQNKKEKDIHEDNRISNFIVEKIFDNIFIFIVFLKTFFL
ncbi:hypothetical protein [Buchnera aphidicola]|uniref:hypothetical protein n=1 Tax=Buchnera aphidicola TaxID=9 RepID=UPI003464B1FF